MQKKHRQHRRKTMKGGFLSGLSGWLDKAKDSAKNLWPNNTGEQYPPPVAETPAPVPQTPAPVPQTTPLGTQTPAPYGGKKGSKKRRMRGGFKDNTPTTGLAAHAASFSGKTAQPHNWVGGKTRRRVRKSKRTRRH